MHPARAIAALVLAAPLACIACLKTTEVSNCASVTPVHNYVLGDTAVDSLTASTCRQAYQFAVASQTNLSFRLSSSGYQTFLQLYDSRGAIIMNSALTEALDTATTVRMMLGQGSYALAVNAVVTGQKGAYRLTTVPDSAPVAGCGQIWVTHGVVTTQTITANDCRSGPSGTGYYTHVYALVLLQGEDVTITETAAAFPPGMTLSGPSFGQASTVDSAGTTASLSSVVITQGAFTLWVGSTTAGQTGTYTLHVN